VFAGALVVLSPQSGYIINFVVSPTLRFVELLCYDDSMSASCWRSRAYQIILSIVRMEQLRW
jgi:hypothetical protein